MGVCCIGMRGVGLWGGIGGSFGVLYLRMYRVRKLVCGRNLSQPSARWMILVLPNLVFMRCTRLWFLKYTSWTRIKTQQIYSAGETARVQSNWSLCQSIVDTAWDRWRMCVGSVGAGWIGPSWDYRCQSRWGSIFGVWVSKTMSICPITVCIFR